MALAQTTLGDIVQIQTGSDATVYTITNSKPSYVRSFLIHNLNDASSQTVEVHIIPNNGGSVGTASSVNKIAKLGISPSDTYFFECAYPITLVNNNDTIKVKNTSGSGAVNVLVLGDKEA